MSDGIPATLEALAVPVGDLVPYAANPRRGDLGSLRESLRHHGQYRPLVARTGTNEVLAGNHTLAAAKELGWTKIAVTYVDCDDDQAARIVLVDNRSNDVAGYDDAALVELLQQVQGDTGHLEGTGFSDADLAALLAEVTGDPVALTDHDDVPEEPAEPVSRLGDVWLLGPHRLVCGDSTDKGTYAALLGDGVEADLIFTDPPYGVDYQGGIADTPSGGHKWTKADFDAYAAHRRRDGLKVSNDALGVDGTRALVRDAMAAAPLKKGGVFYVCAPPGDLVMEFRNAITEVTTLGLRQTVVWVKDQFTFGRSDYHYRHEWILYGWRKGAAHFFVKDRTQDSVWEFPRPRRSKVHPTMKPVDLVSKALRNSSRPGEIVLDLFGGSGSTLIAAHAENRLARLIELDPVYVDVICRRYQEHTGTKPILERTGEPHDFTG